MYKQFKTGILSIFSLVLLDFVSGLPLDGPRTIGHESNEGSPQIHVRKMREFQADVDLSSEKNKDLMQIDTVHLIPRGRFALFNPEFPASNINHNHHWSSEQNYFKDKVSNSRSDNTNYHHFNNYHHKYYHHPHFHQPWHHREGTFRTEFTQDPSPTQSPSTTQSPTTTQSSRTSTNPTTIVPSIDIRMGG